MVRSVRLVEEGIEGLSLRVPGSAPMTPEGKAKLNWKWSSGWGPQS